MALQAVLLAYGFTHTVPVSICSPTLRILDSSCVSTKSPASPFSLPILTDLTAGMTRAEHLDCSGQWYKLVDIDRIASGMHIGDAV